MDITEHTGGYAVAEVAELRTGAFTAEIHRNGRHVVDVENDGRGGCNYYSAVSPELRDEVQALHEYAARDFGDFEPADAFVEALIDIDTAEKNARRNGTSFSAEAEAMITAFKENAIPETIPYMQSTFDLLRKIGAAKDAEDSRQRASRLSRPSVLPRPRASAGPVAPKPPRASAAPSSTADPDWQEPRTRLPVMLTCQRTALPVR